MTGIAAAGAFGAAAGAKFICLGDYANSRGAADMGLYPDLLPGYLPLSERRASTRSGSRVPSSPGLNLRRCSTRREERKLQALYVVGSNPVARYDVDPFALAEPFVVVQDMFLTETAMLADVVLPAAAPMKNPARFTNTCGDLQLLQQGRRLRGREARFRDHRAHCRADGLRRPQLVPFGAAACAPTWASRAGRSRAKPTGRRSGCSAMGCEPQGEPVRSVGGAR